MVDEITVDTELAAGLDGQPTLSLYSYYLESFGGYQGLNLVCRSFKAA